MSKQSQLVSMLLALLLLTGCSTARRVNQFETFANAGKSYTEAMITLTEEAGQVAIDADSEVLLEVRNTLEEDQRRQRYQEHTEALQNLLTEMQALRKHTLLLKRYFVALSELAESDTPTGIGEEATNVAAALQELHPRIENATIGGAPVKDFVGGAVPLVVASFKQKALERELKKNAKIIERELELQNAVLEALATELRADLEVLAARKAYSVVAQPYIATGNIPASWKKDRREVLSTYVTMATVDNAAEAAKELKKTFVALVEKKASSSDFESLFTDISSMIELIELAQGTNEND